MNERCVNGTHPYQNYVFRGKNNNDGVALAKRFGVTQQQQITRIARGER